MQLREGILFDEHYLLIKLLGSGGFSDVWLVENTLMGNKKMALKVYAPGKGLDKDGVKLFSSEFELVFDLNHTNLLRPSHFDVWERSPYLLMPFCENGSANKLVGKMSEKQAWHFLHDVASGLAYLHAQEAPIIHQDIKPDNILITHDERYLITDFGISAKVRSTLRKSVGDTKLGGTLAYMPPERFGKENDAVKASDIWALGATVFELLTGDVPFGEHGGLVQKSGADIPTISGIYSKTLKQLINKMLAKETWNRPVAKKIVEVTENHLKGRKNETIPIQKSDYKRIVWGIASCILGLLISFLIVKSINNIEERSELANIILEEETNLEKVLEEEAVQMVFQTEKFTQSQVITPSQIKEPPKGVDTNPKSIPSSSPSSPPSSPKWLEEYNRTMILAQSLYDSHDYVQAMEWYHYSLNLVSKNQDTSGREDVVRGQIAACEKAIETLERTKREESERKARLDNYMQYGKNLGPYMVVQRFSDKKWGIIDKDGYECSAFFYKQASGELVKGYFGLLSEQNLWDVYNEQAIIIASNIRDLRDYQKQ